MAVFKVETKNKVDIDKKPRVYFTCHPDDFEKYFKKVCEDIFKTHDCAIYYTKDMTEIIAEDERQVDLGRNNLFVVPVTFKLLSTPNRAMDEDIPYALTEHIPVLPIMMEPGIDEFYSKSDKFGELQYLNPYSTDLTEISYEEKLKRYLESVLISDELAKRVRAAFDAYIFLSYRKKDRKYANELMRLIHSNPECRDIAIWFDEFLTPGESFKENIEKILDDCKLFTLLITPQLLEKVVDENGEERDNYVISTELPLARKKKQEKGTDIFAVEMEKTNRESLSSISIEDYTNPQNADFRARLLETISRMAITTNNTPEHNFLIGLAYLEGIDVEVDRERAVELIISAAEADLPEAMEKLYNMYFNGIGVRRDFLKALRWAELHMQYCIKSLGENSIITLEATNKCLIMYIHCGRHLEALDKAEYAFQISRGALGERHPSTILLLHTLLSIYLKLGYYDKFFQISNKTFEFSKEKQIFLNSDILLPFMNLIAAAYSITGNYSASLEINQKAYSACCNFFGEEHRLSLAILHNLAVNHLDQKENENALLLLNKVYDMACKVLGEDDPISLAALDDLATVHARLKKHKIAISLNNRSYHLRCELLGESNIETIHSAEKLAKNYCDIGDYEKALELSKKTYEISCKILGQEHAISICLLVDLIECYISLSDFNNALALQKMMYHYACKTFAKESPEIIQIFVSLTKLYNILASSYSNNKEYDNAVKLWIELYDLQIKTIGEYDAETMQTLLNISNAYKQMEAHQEALETNIKLLSLQQTIFGEEHSLFLKTLQNLAYLYIKVDDYLQAQKAFKKLYELLCKVFGDNAQQSIVALNNYAFCSLKNGNYYLAAKTYQKVYAQFCNLYGEESSDTIQVLANLSQSYYKLGELKKALELDKRIYNLRCKLLGEEHPKTLVSLNNIAADYIDACDFKKALCVLEQLYSYQIKVLGKSHNNTIKTVTRINEVRAKLQLQ